MTFLPAVTTNTNSRQGATVKTNKGSSRNNKTQEANEEISALVASLGDTVAAVLFLDVAVTTGVAGRFRVPGS